MKKGSRKYYAFYASVGLNFDTLTFFSVAILEAIQL